MFLLFLQAIPQLQPIQVTVQQPPGMPEWIKILITAAVGVVAGVVSNSLMEIVKPRIANAMDRAMLNAKLLPEFKRNMGIMEAALEKIRPSSKPEPGWRAVATTDVFLLVLHIRNARFKLSTETNLSLLLEVDPERRLTTFYDIAKEKLPKALELYDYRLIEELLEASVRIGREFLEDPLSIRKPPPGL
jgi:hypothetical protein